VTLRPGAFGARKRRRRSPPLAGGKSPRRPRSIYLKMGGRQEQWELPDTRPVAFLTRCTGDRSTARCRRCENHRARGECGDRVPARSDSGSRAAPSVSPCRRSGSASRRGRTQPAARRGRIPRQTAFARARCPFPDAPSMRRGGASSAMTSSGTAKRSPHERHVKQGDTRVPTRSRATLISRLRRST